MSTHPHRLENLAESIYEDIVKANFRDLDRSDEELVYSVACERAQVEYNDLIHDYMNGLWSMIQPTVCVQCMKITASHTISLWSLPMSKTWWICLLSIVLGCIHLLLFGILFINAWSKRLHIRSTDQGLHWNQSRSNDQWKHGHYVPTSSH